jgi:hypothetical protein
VNEIRKDHSRKGAKHVLREIEGGAKAGDGIKNDFYRRFRQRTDQPQAETEITEIN